MVKETSDREMFYGKGDVFVYRTYAPPLKGVKPIPESAAVEKENIIFGLNVSVQISGRQFLSSFKDGDNQNVVATDSMKNFIQRHLSTYDGSTIDGFIFYVAKKFLHTYPQMETVKITGTEIPFLPTACVINGQRQKSGLVFKKSRDETAFSTVQVCREGDVIKLVEYISGVKDLQFIKISGNSFTGFVQDEYTTLPEDSNRPLFVYLNISWKYQEEEAVLSEKQPDYVLAEQVADLAASVFHGLETKSIQHLIYQIGLRILERFSKLSEVKFESQNRTWETVADEIPNSEGKVYSEPRPPYGFQGFTVSRKDLENARHEPLKEADSI